MKRASPSAKALIGSYRSLAIQASDPAAKRRSSPSLARPSAPVSALGQPLLPVIAQVLALALALALLVQLSLLAKLPAPLLELALQLLDQQVPQWRNGLQPSHLIAQHLNVSLERLSIFLSTFAPLMNCLPFMTIFSS